jgi:proline racemase
MNAVIEVPGLGALRVDTAYGGDSFVVVDAAALGFDLTPDEARDLAETGVRITANANKQLGFHHPQNPDWRHISFCLFAGPLADGPEGSETRHAVAIDPGKIDRSPTGTAVSARLALLHARGQIRPRVPLTAHSLIGGQFQGKIVEIGQMGDVATVTPEISGRAWITGTSNLMLDPDDPWPRGYRLSDTWPGA